MIEIEEFGNYLKNSTLSPKTVRSYLSGLRHFARFRDEITTETVSEYRKSCMETQKPKTVNLRLHAILKYIKWKNLDVQVSLIHIQEPLFAENLLSVADYRKIMNHLIHTGQTDWYILLRTLACTGVRIGESFQITVGDLKSSRKVILGKGTKTRVIWFPRKYRGNVLGLLKGRKDNEQLVTYTEDYIRTKLRLLQKTLKIRCRLSPHEFRRFYARQVYARTKDIYLVKDLLGHSSIETTTRYLRIGVSSVSRRMSRIVDW